MATLSALFTFIVLSVAGNLKGVANGYVFTQQVLKQGETLGTNFSKKFPFPYEECRVFMRPKGSLVVVHKDYESDMVWQSGPAPGHVNGDDYVLQLGERGNMVIKRIVSPGDPRDNVTVYDTHTEGDVGDYFLGVRPDSAYDCLLEIRKGTIGDGTRDNVGDLVWTSIKKGGMRPGETLGTSQILWYDFPNECRDHFMFMNPNGNLEVFKGFFSYRNRLPVWESNTKRERGDYRFIFDENATLILLDVATGEQYWKKDLQRTGHPPDQVNQLQLVSHGCDGRGFGPYTWFSKEDNVFLREGDRLPAGGVHYYNSRPADPMLDSYTCDLTVHYNGRLEVGGSGSGSTTGYWASYWDNGKAKNDTAGDDYFLMLHETGNLAMYRDTIDNPSTRVWATHTKGEVGKYFLSTNELCDLQVYEGTPEEKGGLVWSNRVTKLKSGDRLTKGQRFTPPGACGALMTLQPDTGVLGVYIKHCPFTRMEELGICFDGRDEVWTVDVGLSNYDDFYVDVCDDGKLKFYGVGRDGDELKGKRKLGDLGDLAGDFEVALCDESGLTLPKPVAVYPMAV
uniref:Bulb-type lectin domain-containing protein n=1 Tax=Helicotheca tamesis TaxID=374047 RepID=A0A7S2H1U6_9STRA|mmetsp:Transcript_14453/g.19781  ORF Transcript_14453/g.19781 Transcript_14453/m.19781 type:complete len:566 (+) Transcript_14453:61-1758(+)|eukprot:CAMPEP_0185727336 /NCGR_PEP_ID=MMETSP1171-20130828/3047_1 /TAXON_ID=374046 /ORGANISM="Helicotheca tamensis, Strain CCMP826" /LENGTH=565 /DNA_ID=CAMNT_0028395873 /DNA_START=24 /DNA_END=1721 /DNA_ORIENTATION=+